MGKIFLTSDLHFGHDKEFVWKARGYDSVWDMNESLIEKWNGTVNDEDDVYVLGDLMLGDYAHIKYVKRLKGKLHIVLGNHDTAVREELYRKARKVVEVAEVGIQLTYKKFHFILTHYPMLTSNISKEHLTQMTCNLHGHTHQRYTIPKDCPYMYHVGVDTHNGYPVLLDNIIEEMVDNYKEFYRQENINEKL